MNTDPILSEIVRVDVTTSHYQVSKNSVNGDIQGL